MNNVQMIALDPCSDYIYWISQESEVMSIFKMKLDGTHRQEIISNNKQSPSNSLVIDFISSRLYWAGNYTIQTSDLKGQNRSVYMTMSRRPTVLSLYGDILY